MSRVSVHAKLAVASDTTSPSIVNYFIALSTQIFITLGNRNRGEIMPINVFTTFPVQDLRAAENFTWTKKQSSYQFAKFSPASQHPTWLTMSEPQCSFTTHHNLWLLEIRPDQVSGPFIANVTQSPKYWREQAEQTNKQKILPTLLFYQKGFSKGHCMGS